MFWQRENAFMYNQKYGKEEGGVSSYLDRESSHWRRESQRFPRKANEKKEAPPHLLEFASTPAFRAPRTLATGSLPHLKLTGIDSALVGSRSRRSFFSRVLLTWP